jgi:transitional endoplasmic reticulum ATPase
VLEEMLKKAIQNDYRSFFKSEAVYKHLEVPWKRGLIFLGVSGGYSLSRGCESWG